ncbi:MAG: transcriptional antiterminator, Rof [Gemmatimonadota bacterium]
MSDYRPIACSTHDRLEAAATLRTTMHVTWRHEGEEAAALGVIEDLYVEDGAEYMRIAGHAVRLDRIKELREAG